MGFLCELLFLGGLRISYGSLERSSRRAMWVWAQLAPLGLVVEVLNPRPDVALTQGCRQCIPGEWAAGTHWEFDRLTAWGPAGAVRWQLLLPFSCHVLFKALSRQYLLYNHLLATVSLGLLLSGCIWKKLRHKGFQKVIPSWPLKTSQPDAKASGLKLLSFSHLPLGEYHKQLTGPPRSNLRAEHRAVQQLKLWLSLDSEKSWDM